MTGVVKSLAQESVNGKWSVKCLMLLRFSLKKQAQSG